MPLPVYLLVTSPDSHGGVARATGRLASHLADTREVEIIALRRREDARYAVDPRVKVRCILDDASPSEQGLQRLPSEIPGADRTESYSALVDKVLPRVLHGLPPSIVISTRAILHLELARHAPAHCITIAQDHINLAFREFKSRQQQAEDEDVVTDVDLVREAIGRLDAYVLLTEADADSYRELFPEAADRLRVIRNPAPWPVLSTKTERKKIVVAVGRLGGRKAFDRLIDAYRPIARKRGGWELHIYGEGPHYGRLAKLIEDHKLGEAVFLKGFTDDIESVLEEASILVLTSKYEGLPMVIIEAMTKGLPVVSVDCPNGPAEIVVDGVTGRLVPNKDRKALRVALRQVMGDSAMRDRMGEQALKHAEQYQADRITQNWLDLFDSLEAARAPSA